MSGDGPLRARALRRLARLRGGGAAAAAAQRRLRLPRRALDHLLGLRGREDLRAGARGGPGSTPKAGAAFSLGAADTALRQALDFAAARRLYGGTVLELPHARSVLTNAFLDLLLCDAMATAGARAIEGAPEQLSLWSSVIKYFVPVTCERVIREVAIVLQQQLEKLRAEVAQLSGRKRSPELFAAAERFCGLFAGACALHLWLRSQTALGPFFAQGDWLVACLERLLTLGAVRGREAHTAAAAERMLQLHSGEQAFAHIALALGRGAGK